MNYFISGANRGLGLELVQQLLKRENTTVFATARTPENANELNELAASHPGRLHVYPLDIDNPESIDALRHSLDGHSIDYLINNAGRFSTSGSFGHLDYDAILADFQTNTIGSLRVSEALFDNLLKGEKKVIVHISSKMGSVEDNTSGGHYSYRISKTALNMAMRSMAMDLKKDGVTVVALHPGWVKTRMGGENAPLSSEQSIDGLLHVFDQLTLDQTGSFLEYTGKTLPW